MRRDLISINSVVNNFLIIAETDDRPEKISGRKRRFVLVECLKCTKRKEISWQSVKHGYSKTCGCLQKDTMKAIRTKHGEAKKTPEYSVWCGIIRRCHNKNDSAYDNYGGRGIYVSTEWRSSYENFIHDMGRRPSNKHTIDRINNDEGYTKENCRWTTRIINNNNRRKRRWRRKPT